MQQVSPLDVTIPILYCDLAAINERNRSRPKTKSVASCRGLHLNPMVGK